MNLIAFGLILICCHAWAIEKDSLSLGETYAKKNLKDALENFKPMLRKGFEEYHIPPLDPLIVIDEVPLKIDLSKLNNLKLDALVKNLNVTGLSNYNVNSAELNLSIIKMYVKVNLDWSLVTASTNYNGTGNYLNYKVGGNGEINAAAHDFHYECQINLAMKGLKHIQAKGITSKISLGTLNFVATGLHNYNNDDETSEELSKNISEMVPKMINENQENIIGKINNIFLEELNKFLSSKTLKELLKLLGM